MIERLYEATLRRHLGDLRQMAFVSGPRQVGKTTTCRALVDGARYLNWDDQDHRDLILAGPRAVASEVGLDALRDSPVTVVFDEIHKYPRWQTFLKGFFDVHGEAARIVVTGSSRLDVYRRGGDSLMGRYFHYRMHPLSVGELIRSQAVEAPAPAGPAELPDPEWEALLAHGGFPEPFVRRDSRFSRRWHSLRQAQLVRDDVRDISTIQAVGQLESLVRILASRSATQLRYSTLARQVRVSVDTMRRWIATLVSLYHGFLIHPWHRNVARSLRKEPKWFLRDWSAVEEPGPRAETLVAGHLLKAVQTWEDAGLGEFDLRYLRDKEKHEVDFVVVRDGSPWFLVEVKATATKLGGNLARFQEQVAAPHAFQVVLDMPFVRADCFARRAPCVVPARTFLSQLP